MVGGFPSQKENYAEGVSMSCKAHRNVLMHAGRVSYLYCINTEKETKLVASESYITCLCIECLEPSLPHVAPFTNMD